MPDYKGKSRAEARAMVLAHNKKSGPKGSKNMRSELALWNSQNKDLTAKKKVVEKPKPKEKKPVYKQYSSTPGGGAENKNLARDETYDDYVQSIRSGAQGSGEGDPEGLYKKDPPTQKRGFIMKRNRK